MSKTIFRTMKNADNPFVMIDRRPIENPGLSWKAKGVLAYLLSRPDNWTVRIGDLVKRSSDKAFAIRGAINELVKAGHIYRREERDEKGRISQYVLEVYELPFTGTPLIGFPQADNPHGGNLPLNDIDLKENKLEEDSDAGKIFRLYEQNIGAIFPMIAETLQDAEKEYPYEWIEESFRLAVEYNKRNWRYCETILKRWKTEGKDDGKSKPSPADSRPEYQQFVPEPETNLIRNPKVHR